MLQTEDARTLQPKDTRILRSEETHSLQQEDALTLQQEDVRLSAALETYTAYKRPLAARGVTYVTFEIFIFEINVADMINHIG